MITFSWVSFCYPLSAKIQVGVSDLHFWGFKLPLPPTSQIIEVSSLWKHFWNHSCQQCIFHAYSLTALCRQTDQNSTKQLGAWQRKEMCNMGLGEILVGEQPSGVYEMRRVVGDGEHSRREMNGCVSSDSWKMERPAGECLAGQHHASPGGEQRNQGDTLPRAVRLLKYRCYVGKTVKTP